MISPRKCVVRCGPSDPGSCELSTSPRPCRPRVASCVAGVIQLDWGRQKGNARREAQSGVEFNSGCGRSQHVKKENLINREISIGDWEGDGLRKVLEPLCKRGTGRACRACAVAGKERARGRGQMPGTRALAGWTSLM